MTGVQKTYHQLNLTSRLFSDVARFAIRSEHEAGFEGGNSLRLL
jgi:hypothetical protein